MSFGGSRGSILRCYSIRLTGHSRHPRHPRHPRQILGIIGIIGILGIHGADIRHDFDATSRYLMSYRVSSQLMNRDMASFGSVAVKIDMEGQTLYQFQCFTFGVILQLPLPFDPNQGNLLSSKFNLTNCHHARSLPPWHGCQCRNFPGSDRLV